MLGKIDPSQLTSLLGLPGKLVGGQLGKAINGLIGTVTGPVTGGGSGRRLAAAVAARAAECPAAACRARCPTARSRGWLMRIRLLAALLAALTVLTGCGFHGLYGMHLPGGADVGSHPLTLTIYFDNVLDLVPQSSVKVNDVPVGRVEDVTLSAGTTTPATAPPTAGRPR